MFRLDLTLGRVGWPISATIGASETVEGVGFLFPLMSALARRGYLIRKYRLVEIDEKYSDFGEILFDYYLFWLERTVNNG